MDADDGSGATATPALEAVAASFRSKVMELQDLVLARNMFPATVEPELGNVDSLVTAMETQVRTMRLRIQEELDTIPKAKKLLSESLKQQEKLQHMLANLPSGMPKATHLGQSLLRMEPQCSNFDSSVSGANKCDLKIKDDPVAVPRKGRAPAPRWYVSTEELDSLSSYMRGRLTLEKVNIAINEVASYADVNAHLVTCPNQKLSEDTRGKALELRDLAAKEALKGKYFFLEADIKGPGLKLDITGKAILTVLRHLGRFHEVRIGSHRVFILSKQS